MARAETEALRAAMAQAGLDAFIIPTADPHGSEYPPLHFKAREYFSGFTGSAGTLAAGPDWAGLWTDGRYFLQAEKELAGSGIELFRMGESGVPTLNEQLAAKAKRVGADLACLTAAEGLELAAAGIELVDAPEIIGDIWQTRPALPGGPARILEMEYTGVSAADKLAALRAAMAGVGADACILTALDDTAWLFNIRGCDVEYLPVAVAYAVVERERAYLFMDGGKAADIRSALMECGVEILDYSDIYTFVRRYAHSTVMASPDKLNYRLYLELGGAKLAGPEYVGPAKAVKNPIELENMRRVHLEDGAALSRLIHHIKTHAADGLTELDVCDMSISFRAECPDFEGLSFSTIAGYGAHAAIVHYHATDESSVTIQPRGLLLLDSGGQYRGGTTDVTRTIAVGEVSAEEKRGFTIVLESMLELLYSKFRRGCRGAQLDMIARAPLWAEGMDYNHGTGHGVGYMLSVHEGPNRFRYHEYDGSAVILPGMITSDEPGLYVAGSYGVRLENLVECVEDVSNEFGSFLRFESLTYAPIDLDAIDTGLLSDRGRERLNRYHAEVYARLAPLMKEEELVWLREYTRAI